MGPVRRTGSTHRELKRFPTFATSVAQNVTTILQEVGAPAPYFFLFFSVPASAVLFFFFCGL